MEEILVLETAKVQWSLKEVPPELTRVSVIVVLVSFAQSLKGFCLLFLFNYVMLVLCNGEVEYTSPTL